MSAETANGTAHVDTYQLAAELGVDATLLRRFVDEHPRPTAPIVLGWGHRHGELAAHPEQLRGDVEAWLKAGGRNA